MTEEKNYMLVQDGCGVCKDAKELYKEPIKQKKLIILDIGSEKGAELVEKHKVELVPTIINEKDMFQQKYLFLKMVIFIVKMVQKKN